MHLPCYRCPKCAGSDFKRWAFPHPLILHWMVNPAVAVNELALGQRIPKLQLVCRTCDGALLERASVPCPVCGQMHLGRLWTRARAFRNWRGVSCPACGASIPCLWNVFSLLLLALTSPIWALPYHLYFNERPLRPIYDLVDGSPPKPRAFTRRTWILAGVAWGALMWAGLWVWALVRPEEEPVSHVLAVGLPICAMGGIIYGFMMWLFLGRRSHRGCVTHP